MIEPLEAINYKETIAQQVAVGHLPREIGEIIGRLIDELIDYGDEE